MTKRIAIALLAASALSFAAATPAKADFVLALNGGDGSVSDGPDPYSFTLTGADNSNGSIVTTYTDQTPIARVLEFFYRYETRDVDGSSFDRAGYFVNGIRTQLSVNGQPFNSFSTGSVSVNLAANDFFGFYIDSSDSAFGPASLSIGISAAPEPGTWAMMIAGFGMAGTALRYRRRRTRVTFA